MWINIFKYEVKSAAKYYSGKFKKNYTLLKIDVTQNSEEDKKLMKKFNIFGPPAMIFYKNGEEEKDKRIIGFKNVTQFLEIIK